MDDMQIPLMVDSGAYSAFTRKQAITLDEWITFCQKLKRKCPHAEYVNLDVISNTSDSGALSYANWCTMRGAGLNPIPVYHCNSDEKWLRKYLKGTDYIAVGAIADVSTRRRVWSLDRLWKDYLVDENGMPKVKIHAMGVTSFPLVRRYPWFSLDSTSFLQAAIYGKIFVAKLTNGQWDYTKAPYIMALSSESPKKMEDGQHISTLNPSERRVLDRYITENGFKLGKFEGAGKELKVIEPGLSVSYDERMHLNAIYFARFVRYLPWPRPFKVAKVEGLFV